MSKDLDHKPPLRRRRVFVLGATGTIGRATLHALLAAGHEVVCFIRPRPSSSDLPPFHDDPVFADLQGVHWRFGDVTDAHALARDGFCGETFDVVLSCLASRTGAPRDAWAIDYQAHHALLEIAKKSGVSHVILLSALCVQKPVLAFQKAKLAFETELIASGLRYSIIRPTAFFKSLSGQVERVRRGKSFLMFGDGTLTACKPISDEDLAAYLVGSIDDETRWNKILPIGGPGKAITPREQGDYLFARLHQKPRFTHVPVALFKIIIAGLSFLGRWSERFAEKAEFARTGFYYATESMLVMNPETGRYDEALTPSTGTKTLFDHYDELISGTLRHERGDHSVF